MIHNNFLAALGGAEYFAAATAILITLQTMLKRHVFKNYDVFKVFHWDWDLQNLLTQLTKLTINTILKATPGVDSL